MSVVEVLHFAGLLAFGVCVAVFLSVVMLWLLDWARRQ